MKELLRVGFDKNGEIDFSISGVAELSYEQMKVFREMLIVAIGVAEDVWKRNQAIEPAEESANIDKITNTILEQDWYPAKLGHAPAMILASKLDKIIKEKGVH